MSFCLQPFCRLFLQARWRGSCIKKKKIDSIRSKDYDLCIFDQLYQFISEVPLGGFQDTGYLGKKLIGCKKFRGKINRV